MRHGESGVVGSTAEARSIRVTASDSVNVDRKPWQRMKGSSPAGHAIIIVR